MKNLFFFSLLILINFGCKKPKDKSENSLLPKERLALDTLKNDIPNIIIKDTLISTFDFKSMLNKLKNVKHTKDKHHDWMFNKASTLRTSLELNFTDFRVKSTSYTYKKDCVFYLHTLKHTNDSISIKPFLENAQGKPTEGYTTERVLIFAMKNDKEANFIDIPSNWNFLKLQGELIDLLYDTIDSDVILCENIKLCQYKDLRK